MASSWKANINQQFLCVFAFNKQSSFQLIASSELPNAGLMYIQVEHVCIYRYMHVVLAMQMVCRFTCSDMSSTFLRNITSPPLHFVHTGQDLCHAHNI